MKKIFTLILVAVGSISFASAQSFRGNDGHNKDHKSGSNVIVQNNRFTKTNNVNYNDAKFMYQQEQEKMNRINREYDQKNAFVKNNRRLNNWGETKQIQSLQNERDHAQRSFNVQYASDHRSNSSRYDSHKW